MVLQRSDAILFAGLCAAVLTVGACTPMFVNPGSENSTPRSGTFPYAGTKDPPGVEPELLGPRAMWNTPTQLVIILWGAKNCYPVPTGSDRVGDQHVRIDTVEGWVIAPGLAKVSTGGACQASLGPTAFGFTNPGISSDKPGTITVSEQRPGRPQTEKSFEVAAYSKA